MAWRVLWLCATGNAAPVCVHCFLGAPQGFLSLLIPVKMQILHERADQKGKFTGHGHDELEGNGLGLFMLLSQLTIDW